MKDFRRKMIISQEPHHQEMFQSLDFFGLSTFRDLLFHTQEHQFTLIEIKNCLLDLGLHFCGFQIETVKSANTIEKEDLYNLNAWNSYEASNPAAFSAMYQFWCQKP